MKHIQVNMKVNVLVDEKIVSLVGALNRIDGIFTIDSCQGSSNESAYVYFKYGSSPKDLAVFCSILAERLSTHVEGSNDWALRVEWDYDFSTNIAVLVTSQGNIRQLAKAINSVANAIRRTSSACDKTRKREAR